MKTIILKYTAFMLVALLFSCEKAELTTTAPQLGGEHTRFVIEIPQPYSNLTTRSIGNTVVQDQEFDLDKEAMVAFFDEEGNELDSNGIIVPFGSWLRNPIWVELIKIDESTYTFSNVPTSIPAAAAQIVVYMNIISAIPNVENPVLNYDRVTELFYYSEDRKTLFTMAVANLSATTGSGTFDDPFLITLKSTPLQSRIQIVNDLTNDADGGLGLTAMTDVNGVDFYPLHFDGLAIEAVFINNVTNYQYINNILAGDIAKGIRDKVALGEEYTLPLTVSSDPFDESLTTEISVFERTPFEYDTWVDAYSRTTYYPNLKANLWHQVIYDEAHDKGSSNGIYSTSVPNAYASSLFAWLAGETWLISDSQRESKPVSSLTVPVTLLSDDWTTNLNPNLQSAFFQSADPNYLNSFTKEGIDPGALGFTFYAQGQTTTNQLEARDWQPDLVFQIRYTHKAQLNEAGEMMFNPDTGRPIYISVLEPEVTPEPPVEMSDPDRAAGSAEPVSKSFVFTMQSFKDASGVYPAFKGGYVYTINLSQIIKFILNPDNHDNMTEGDIIPSGK